MLRAARPAAAVLSLVAVLGTVVAGCTVGPSQRPPVAVRGENVVAAPSPPEPGPPESDTLPVPEPQDTSLQFLDCTDEGTDEPGVVPAPTERPLRVECADLSVPADPAAPGIGIVALGVVRVGLADAPLDRPPLLVLGDSAGEPSARHAVALAAQVAPALLDRFTLIGLDRRGSGSDTLNCAPPGARSALLDADPAAITEADLTDLLERARAVVQDCTVALDGGLGRFRTSATAADVEFLRAELGVTRLSGIGVGDGAAALAGWARDAPRSVGRLVLDGPPDPALDEPELGESRAEAAETAFDAFAVACTSRPDCPLGTDPRAVTSTLVDALRAQPLVASDGRRLTVGGALTAVRAGLGEPRGWPALATAVAAAGAGDAAPLLEVLSPITGPRGRFDGALAIACNDTRRRAAPGEVSVLAQEWRAAHPLFGTASALHLIACAPWPTGGVPPTTGRVEGAPPILVLGTAADPRVTLESMRRAAENVSSASFVTWQGSGTGAYPRTACVSAAVDRLLIDGVVPAADMLCPS